MSILERDPLKRAAEMGQKVVYPHPEELFIDIDDGKAGLAHLDNMLSLLEKVMPGAAAVSRKTMSKSGGWHVVVLRRAPLSNIERIGLQAVLGSDRTRELLSFLHLFNRTLEQPTCFFENEATEHGYEAKSSGCSGLSDAGKGSF